MPLVELSLETLKEFDGGKIAVLFNQALKQVVDDCTNRPGDKSRREVVVKLSVKPVVDSDGQLETIKIKPHVKTKLPEFHSREIDLLPRRLQGRGNVLAFNPASPDARQADLGFEE